MMDDWNIVLEDRCPSLNAERLIKAARSKSVSVLIQFLPAKAQAILSARFNSREPQVSSPPACSRGGIVPIPHSGAALHQPH
jgi:hypothetical protein